MQETDKKMIEDRIGELKQLFSQTQNKISATANEYNEQIKSIRAAEEAKVNELLQEAEAKINKLAEEREQFRGAYTELFYILNPEERIKDAKLIEQQEGAQQESNSVAEVSQATVELGSVSSSEIKENKETDKIEEDVISEKSNLTEEEIQAITQVTNQEEASNTVDTVNNDIPEYLQEEYNKK